MRGLAVAAVLVGIAPLSVAPPEHDTTKVVEYAGYRVEVPRSWPVHRLTDDPTRCVRFDRHAVYLGRPSPEQRCPAKMVGRTSAVLIEPLDGPAPHDAVILPPNQAATGPLPETVSEEAHVAVTGAGLLVTASYGASRTVDRILSGASLTPAASPARTTREIPPRLGMRRKNNSWGREWRGKGFDTCSAPSTRQMGAWRASPYRAVGIYIGGANRACSNRHLTAPWVNTAHRMGWHLLPIYVGRQAPCNTYLHTINPLFPARQGRAAARDAVADARGLGIGIRNPIYFDMEAYGSALAPCRRAVLRFLSAWTEELHRLGYISGVYSSAASGARDLGRAGDHITKPDNIWFAHWDGRPSTKHCRYLTDDWWVNHRRVKQYRGGHHETHAGVTLNIDNNQLNGDVAHPGRGPKRNARHPLWRQQHLAEGVMRQSLRHHPLADSSHSE